MSNFLIGGVPLIANENVVVKVQARTHRKSRINKKWLKRYGMKEVPGKHLIYVEGMIVGHPKTIEKLRKKISLFEVKEVKECQ